MRVLILKHGVGKCAAGRLRRNEHQRIRMTFLHPISVNSRPHLINALDHLHLLVGRQHVQGEPDLGPSLGVSVFELREQ